MKKKTENPDEVSMQEIIDELNAKYHELIKSMDVKLPEASDANEPESKPDSDFGNYSVLDMLREL